MNYFLNEIALIADLAVRNFVLAALQLAPEYIADCPSSSSGKYHPEDELGPDGLIRHTKKVVTVCRMLLSGTSGVNADLAFAACILHDLRKQGVTKSGHTVKDHPELAAQLVEETAVANPDLLCHEQVKALRDAVGYHYGPWGSGRWSDYKSAADKLSRLVHTADYIASRKETKLSLD